MSDNVDTQKTGSENQPESMETQEDEPGSGVGTGVQHRSLFGMSTQKIPLITSLLTDATCPEGITSRKEQFSPVQMAQEVESPEMTELRKEKIRLEHALFLANEELNTVRELMQNSSETENAQKRENEMLLKDRNERLAVIKELEAERDQLLLSKKECEQRADLLLRQKQELEAKISRLVHEKSLLASDLQLQKNEKTNLLEKIVSLEVKIDESAKERRMVEYEKERWAQEKEIYLHNKDWFMNEIKERDQKFALLRIEMVRYTGELQAEVASVTDKYESAVGEIKNLKATLVNRNEEIARMNNRFKEILEDNAQKLNKLEEELLASERISSVYKEASDDAENNLRQLSEDFENRGRLLEESKKAYDSLSLEFEAKQVAFTEQIAEKDKKIRDLSDELQKINELLKSGKRVTLTDDEIMEFSPAAAAASALIRSGVSLTGIYREHCRVVSELEESKAEKNRIEKYFHELVEDLEAKAPLLVQQRKECERFSELCKNLEEQLKLAEEERLKIENARDATLRELSYTKAELERYQRDTEDLSKQVRYLLYALESGGERNRDSLPLLDENPDMLWTSIGELQKVNQKLMSDLRTANANHDREVEEANNAEVTKLRNEWNNAINQLAIVKGQCEKQKLLIEELQNQRDTYKRIGDGKKTQEESHALTKQIHEFESENALLRAKYERAEKSLELFREEKRRSDEILQGRIDQQFTLIAELRKTNGKLEGDVELQKQMQIMLTKQMESDSNELNLTREKYAKMDANYKTVDERCRKLQEELMETKDEVAKYKTDVESLTEKVSLLRSTEARLQQELHVLRESNYSNEKMSHTLKLLENRLQHNDEEKVKTLEIQLQVAKNENDSLKKFVSEISEQHRLISLDLKMTMNKIQTERDQALAGKKSAEDRLVWRNKEFTDLQTKYDDLMKQLKSPDTNIDTSNGNSKKEAQQLRNRNNYLENQLKEATKKLEVSEKMLAIREQELAEITKLSNNMETALEEQGASSVAERKSLQSMLDLVKQQLMESVGTVESQRAEIVQLEQQLYEGANKIEQIKMEKQKELQSLEKRYSNLDVQRTIAESRARQLEMDVAKIATEKASMEEQCSRFKDDINKLEEELRTKMNEITNLKNSAMDFEQKSKDIRQSCASEVGILNVEKSRVEEELRTANAVIEEQKRKLDAMGDNLVKISERMAFLERSVDISACSEDVVVPSDSRSAGALYDVIKYLQGENRQSMERMMNAELQWKRLQAQQATADEHRLKLEEEIQKLRSEAESHVRAIAEKSEMVGRLALMEGIQKENQSLKGQNELLSRRCEQMSRSLSELQVRVASMDAEKVAEKGKFQNVFSDLQTCRKEVESWKERHNQALISLGKFGPERVVTLVNEVEVLKRKLSVLTTERDSVKKEMEKCVQEAPLKETLASVQKKLDESESERAKQLAKFEQARLIARQYRMKSQTLEKELEVVKTKMLEKSTVEEEATRLKQELLAARTEIEKQKFQRVGPRTGWPAESGPSGSTISKTNSILQTQMKQMEGLNQQNKDLTKQLEELSERYKMAQAKLIEYEAKLRESKIESDTKEELRFRLNSITSMLTKKEQEVNRLREELENSKKKHNDCVEKIQTLEAALEACREELNSRTGFSEAPVIKPVSSTTSITAQCGSSPVTSLSTSNDTLHDLGVLSKEETPTTSHPVPLAEFTTAVTGHSAKHDVPIQEVVLPSDSAEEHGSRCTSVSTTSDQSQAVASSSGGSVSPGRNMVGIVKFGGLGTSSPLKPANPLTRWGLDLSSSSSSSENTHHDVLNTVAAPQSNTVSQSSSGGVIQTRLQQHNVISGSGDGANVITSSVVSGDSQIPVPVIPSQVGPRSLPMAVSGESTLPRKRIYPLSSDQSSLIEAGSDVLEPRKRQRESPMEQVSTTGRFMNSGAESRIEVEQRGTEEAEQEQQGSVETTTSPEGDRSDDAVMRKRDKTAEVAVEAEEVGADINNEAVGEVIAQVEGRDEEEQVEHGIEVLMGGVDHGREASADEDNLSEEAGDEMLEEMEDEEFDEEEIDEEEGEFDLPQHYRRPTFHPIRVRPHLGPGNDDGDEDEVILIEDDDVDGDMEQSNSPVDLSTDEAHGDSQNGLNVVDDDVETSTVEGREFQGIRGESIRHIESRSEVISQQPGNLNMDMPVSQASVANDRSRSEHCNSEALYVPSAELEHSQPHSLDTALQEGGDVVSGSELQAVHDSPPLIENIESDSRGASSTVAPVLGTDVDSGDSEHALVIGEDESGNEVAEEEQGDRHSAQTDDEAGSFGPSTSDGSGNRRIRIRYPDITEPTSSSSDATHPVFGSTLRGTRSVRSRRGRGRRML